MIIHEPSIKPATSAVELGRGADGIVVEVLDHPEVVIKDMNHALKLGRNRVLLEIRVLHAVIAATNGRGATHVFNQSPRDATHPWLVRERVFDVFPRGNQEERRKLIDLILQIYPNADISIPMLIDP